MNIEVRHFDGTVRVEELPLVMYNNIGTMKSRIRTGTLLLFMRTTCKNMDFAVAAIT